MSIHHFDGCFKESSQLPHHLIPGVFGVISNHDDDECLSIAQAIQPAATCLPEFCHCAAASD